MTCNPISQNNDDHFYTAVCAYVRGEPNGIVAGTVGEEQAEIAKRLLQDNPAILDDKDRLLAEIATIHYRESGMEAAPAGCKEYEKSGGRVHNGRVNRDCISMAEYDRRMEERRAASLSIDPSIAEIEWWYAQTLDPYGDGLPLLPRFLQIDINGDGFD